MSAGEAATGFASTLELASIKTTPSFASVNFDLTLLRCGDEPDAGNTATRSFPISS
jgi:hypothetical protein